MICNLNSFEVFVTDGFPSTCRFNLDDARYFVVYHFESVVGRRHGIIILTYTHRVGALVRNHRQSMLRCRHRQVHSYIPDLDVSSVVYGIIYM